VQLDSVGRYDELAADLVPVVAPEDGYGHKQSLSQRGLIETRVLKLRVTCSGHGDRMATSDFLPGCWRSLAGRGL